MTLQFAKLDSLAEHSPLTLDHLPDLYRDVRRTTQSLCAPLGAEDCCIQSMPDVSPTKWHLAHTTWFFETFVLREETTGYQPFHLKYAVLFNSYYNSVGEQHSRPHRGLLSRPTLDDVVRYRRYVDEAMERMFVAGNLSDSASAVIEQGLHHEQQHQELMLMDIKHVFYCNPLRPAYTDLPRAATDQPGPIRWMPFEGRVEWVGHDQDSFAFDNESPRHRRFIESFRMADRLTTCGEYLEFIEDGGYERPELWLSDGWKIVQERQWRAPLYWELSPEGEWQIMTLGGTRPVEAGEPVVHVSYYEADAFARWSGAWLPQEAAWESVASQLPIDGNFVENGHLHPTPLGPGDMESPRQRFGDVWEWTCSPYTHYPGYRAGAGARGEYTGKFMCNQMVLRGGSCVTPASHLRTTYRNFYPPDARWAFSGIRLTREHNPSATASE